MIKIGLSDKSRLFLFFIFLAIIVAQTYLVLNIEVEISERDYPNQEESKVV